MDAQTYPNGVLEEMEASPHKMEKPAEIGNLQRKCGHSSQLQKGILADSRQPNTTNSPGLNSSFSILTTASLYRYKQGRSHVPDRYARLKWEVGWPNNGQPPTRFLQF